MNRRGRTRLISARVREDRIDAILVGTYHRVEAEFAAERGACNDQDLIFASMREGGDIWHWHGRSPAHPAPTGDGYSQSWIASDATFRIEAARLAGTLRLDGLANEGDRASGTLPLILHVMRPGKWTVRSTSCFAKTNAAIRTLLRPHGLDRLAHSSEHLLPALESDCKAWSRRINQGTANRWDTGDPVNLREALNLLAPQRVPEALVAGSEVRAAWILPPPRHWSREVPQTIAYQLLTLSSKGDLGLRDIVDSHDCSVLPWAVRQPCVDRMPRILWEIELGNWIRGTDDDPFAFSGLYVDERVPERACDQLSNVISAGLRRVAEEVFEYLEPGLRDTFVGTDDYNVLHASGDAEKASARKQASESIWGGLSLLLSQDKPGKALLETVDARFKLQRAAARALKVKPWVVRRLTTTDHAVLNLMAEQFGFFNIPRVLQWLGPQVRIRAQDDVKNVSELMDFTHRSERKFSFEERAWGLAGSGSSLTEFLTGLVGRTIAQFGWDGAKEIVRGATLSGTSNDEIVDYLRYASACFSVMLHERVRNNYFLDSPDTRIVKAMTKAFSTATFVDVVRWSGRYHDLVATMHIPRGEKPGRRVAFPPVPEVLPETVLPVTGWTARQLRDQEALADEGGAMRHCVADYGERVASRATAIFSLANNDDRVTVEVAQSQHGGWRMLQARVRNNKPVVPNTDAHHALDEFLSVLDSHAKPPAPAKKRKAAPDAPEAYRHAHTSHHSFAHRLVEAYGLQGWTRLRGTLPGSAHGRVETKLWEAYVAANPAIPKRMVAATRHPSEVYAAISAAMQGR